MNLRNIIVPDYLLILSFLIIGCSEKKSDSDTADHQQTHAEESLIKLSEDEIAEFGIILGKAQSGKLKMQINVPGEIVIPPDNLAHIHPRFPGMVKDVKKHIGDRVNEGEILAIIESNESLTDYQLKSLIDGTIVEKHITRGEIVEADMSPHGFVVADLSVVWVYLNLYQPDLPFVKNGQKVTISLGPGLEQTKGRIDYISPIIDETTRTAKARVVLANPRGIWKPGLFVSGSIVTDEFEVPLAVPKTAIETMDNRSCIFIRSDQGFEPRFITAGRDDQTLVEVLDGLSAGEIYVAKGGFTLKAELQKEQFGDGHGH
jgi:cobalt-zinc-cadmium efflux system membrane fusion protein